MKLPFLAFKSRPIAEDINEIEISVPHSGAKMLFQQPARWQRPSGDVDTMLAESKDPFAYELVVKRLLATQFTSDGFGDFTAYHRKTYRGKCSLYMPIAQKSGLDAELGNPQFVYFFSRSPIVSQPAFHSNQQSDALRLRDSVIGVRLVVGNCWASVSPIIGSTLPSENIVFLLPGDIPADFAATEGLESLGPDASAHVPTKWQEEPRDVRRRYRRRRLRLARGAAR